MVSSASTYPAVAVSDGSACLLWYGVCGLGDGFDVGGFDSAASGVNCSAAVPGMNVEVRIAARGNAGGDTLGGGVVRTLGGGQLLLCAADGVGAVKPGCAVVHLPLSLAAAASCAAVRTGPVQE